MNPKLTETIYVDFVTSAPTTGAAIDADSTPTAEVFEDATDTSILAPTVVKRTGKTGNYRVPIACTSANGFEPAKSYNVLVSATVGGVAAKAVVRSFQMRTNCIDDPAILTAAYDPAKTAMQAGASVTVGTNNDKTGYSLVAAYDSSKTAASPAQVQAELVTYGAAKPGNAMTLTAPYDPAKTAASPTQVKAQADQALVDIGLTSTVTGRIDAAISTRSAPGAQMALTVAYDAAKFAASQTSVDAIKAVVDAIKVIDDRLNTAMEVDGPVYRFTTNALEQSPIGSGGGTVDNNAIADAILKRDWTVVSGEAVYSLLNAARMLRNSWATTGGVLTVKKEDGATTAWTRVLATDPTAQPITGAS